MSQRFEIRRVHHDRYTDGSTSDPAPDWGFGEQTEWARWIAGAFRILAAPDLPQEFPSAPKEGDDVLTACAYWAALHHLLTYRLGWSRPDLGLCWWLDAGQPDDDPTLALIGTLWARDGQLAWYAAWLCDSHAQHPSPLHSLAHGSQPTSSAWEPLRTKRLRHEADSSGVPNPLSGGSDPLHLSVHCDGPLQPCEAEAATLLHGSIAARRAILSLTGSGGWYRALIDLGRTLPDIAPRSWHIDVFSEPVGWLGTFRRSRETGLWFTGRHSLHRRGNP